MLIETARRAEADVKDLVAMTNRGGFGCAELREALSVSKAIEGALSAFRTNAASIIARSERHGDGGAGVLAEVAGLSRRDARGQIKSAEAIAEVPSVRDAVEQGRVSQANARRLAEAVKKTSAEAVEADAGLLAKAESLRPEQFAKESRRWASTRQDDGGEREYQRLRAERRVHVWDADDGTVQLHGTFDPVTGRRIKNRLRAEARRMYDTDKKHVTADADGRASASSGDGGRINPLDVERRTFEQCMADALDNLTSQTLTGTTKSTDAGAGERPNARTGIGSATLAGTDTGTEAGHAASAGGGRPFADISVIAHVDSATGKLIAELPDGARLPEAVLEELACNARLTGLVYGTAGTPIWRAKSSRTATEAQRRVLLDRWGGCFHCAADPGMCQIHHIVPVSQGGATKIDNMVPVCWDCHQKIHHQHWQIHKHPDGEHTLHPPNSAPHVPAHAPDVSLLFRTTEDRDYQPAPAHESGQVPMFTNGNRDLRKPSPPPTRAHRPRQPDPALASND